jgi:hypothetical protein
MGALVPNETQFDLLRRLESESLLPSDVYQLFDVVRRVANTAYHAMSNDASKAGSGSRLIQLDEQDTRKLIDQQLLLAGWTVDSAALTYAKGARPEKNKNLAIAEYPTASGL